jgi:hypothetical protein
MKLSNWFARDGAERPLVWPCVTLALLFLLDLWVNPHFLALRMLRHRQSPLRRRSFWSRRG